MKIFYALCLLFQMLLARFRRDNNRIAYLKHLWSDHGGSHTPLGSSSNYFSADSDYQETKSEMTGNDYSLLLEK
jgi:hypothetical protein